jgi:UDP-N-acetyl-D-mannosaminuronate dehydrogenase
VLLLGVTYKPNVADQRESPALPVARRLLELGASIRYHDPSIAQWDVGGRLLDRAELDTAVQEVDLVVVLQPHACYDLEDLAARAALMLDTRGTVRGERVERL